ncbi:hypothetical protein [Leifsonia shinshuensis]|uniref:Uncharacterized protein n=1 Tax=Leifsonia shinshuensis TaxID=150026 RepID=A0A853CWV6_9MICO|nr:hypothetical protein [Leifsonia shinshuensis]NYJ25586.1 hypothetical protein [Leifsonia shinshuensis]
MTTALNDLLFRMVYGERLCTPPSRLRRAFCDSLFRALGHRACCRLPEWTAHIGQRWDSFDVAPWNLYNLLWAAQTWIRQGMTR